MNVLISVIKNEQIDAYFTKNDFVYKERTKCKNLVVFIVTRGIVELKSQCQRKTLRLDDPLRAKEKGFFTNL